MKVRRSAPKSERDARNTSFANMQAVAEEFKNFRPASVALTRVRAVPTIFTGFDLATRVGGFPIERFTLIHGPSTGGKTSVAIGFMLSFLLRGHPVLFVDAEYTTTRTWVEREMGPFFNHPLFLVHHPKTYEETRDKVREFLNRIHSLREKKKLSEDTSALVVVDSIRKLIPADQFARIMKEKNKGADGVRNRMGQIKAQMNSAWLDELVPLLYHTRTAMMAVAREISDPNNTNPQAARFKTNVMTSGGGALFYDASLDLRSTKVGTYGKVVKGSGGEDETKIPYGDIHEIAITKSKVAGKEEFRAKCRFFVSNGVWTPPGIDRARDLLEVARKLDIVEGTSWLKFGSKKWQGEHLAVRALHQNPELFDKLNQACREEFPNLVGDVIIQ